MAKKIIKAYMRLLNNNEVFCYSDGYMIAEESDTKYSEGVFTCDFLAIGYNEEIGKTIAELVIYDFENDEGYIILFYSEEDFEFIEFDYPGTYIFINDANPSLTMRLNIETFSEPKITEWKALCTLTRVKLTLGIPL